MTYIDLCENSPRCSNKQECVEFCEKVLESKPNIQIFVSDWTDLEDVVNNYINHKNKLSDVTSCLKRFNKKYLRDNANKILSTKDIHDYSERYFSILEFKRDDYLNFINHHLKDIDLDHECFVYQSINSIMRHPELKTGIATIFTKDENDNSLRDWYKGNVGDVSATVVTTSSPRFQISTPEENHSGHHADIVPAEYINALIQALIIVFVASDNDLSDITLKEQFLRFLVATRLNMTFINILSNVVEPSDLNMAFLDSFYTNTK